MSTLLSATIHGTESNENTKVKKVQSGEITETSNGFQMGININTATKMNWVNWQEIK